MAIKAECQPPLTDYLSLLPDVEDDDDLSHIVIGSGDANLDFNNPNVSMGLNCITTGHKMMLSSFFDQTNTLAKRISKCGPVKPNIKQEVKIEELEPCTLSTPTQETINLVVFGMIQLRGESNTLLWMAVGQEHIMGEEGPS